MSLRPLGLGTAQAAPEFSRLLAYPGLTERAFAQHERRYFARLRELLARASSQSPGPQLDRSSYPVAVRAFQQSEGMKPNGLPGESTLWALQRDWAVGRKLDVIKLPADPWIRPGRSKPAGYNRFRFRQDAVPLYRALRSDVLNAGGIITSSSSLRGLRATVHKGRSSKSMHFSGLAFDLAVSTGMHNADVDPYIVTQEGRYWRVWARAGGGTTRQLNAIEYSHGSKSIRTRPVTARVVDFTALAERHGFQRIGARRSFPAHYLSAEWWHFEATTLLYPWIWLATTRRS